jgi:tetratricopeptide (TPR) repeat protein
MKKFLIAVVLISATAVAQTTPAPAQGASSPAQQKTIKDPAEYNAYITATGLTDPNQKASALDSFVQQYPNSVVKEDALAAEMAAYQQAGNSAKSMEVAAKVLQANPNNVPACVVLVYGKRQDAVKTQNVAEANEAGDQATRCLAALQTWQMPEGMKPEDFQKQKTVFTSILNNAAGTKALQAKDYPTAQKYLSEAVKANPKSPDDTYNLALAYLLPKPNTDENTLTGLWYIGRALGLVAGNAAAEKQIGDYGKSVYRHYHGADDGWDQFVAQVKAAPDSNPPADLATMIKKAPSPAEQVKTILAQNPDLTQADFGTWVLVFTYGDQQSKDTAFEQLKGKAFKFQGQVITADENSVDVALTQDAIDAKKPEVHVTMEEPFKKAPAAGSQFQFQGTAESYTSEPFLITMDKGIDLSPKPKAPTRKPPVKRPATRKK